MSLRPGLFLDRDGVINRERGEHTWRTADFELLPGVAESVRSATDAGYDVVVITNQSGIGLGLYGHAEVMAIHERLESELAASGARINLILYCPHHPSKGKCLCRKPGGLLLERSIARLGIDPARSVMIGDRERDVQSAESAGVRGVLVPANGDLRNAVMRELRPA